jgi:hypothetical protein
MNEDDQVMAPKLRADVWRTQGDNDRAQSAIYAVANESVPGLPEPDWMSRLQQTGQEASRTLELYALAVARYSDFVFRGVIPNAVRTSVPELFAVAVAASSTIYAPPSPPSPQVPAKAKSRAR